MSKALTIRWLKDVAPHDYEAALNYLTLRLDRQRASSAVRDLKAVPLEYRRANDILRACGLRPLTLDDQGVRKNFDKFLAGEKLSPVLAVSFELGGDIADGYHRVSLAYLLSPYTLVPLRMVSASPAA